MTATALTMPAAHEGWRDLLLDLVRPEFRYEVIIVATGDPVMGFPACSVDGCTRPGSNKGMCTAHYQRWVFEGEPHGNRGVAILAPIRRDDLPRSKADRRRGQRIAAAHVIRST